MIKEKSPLQNYEEQLLKELRPEEKPVSRALVYTLNQQSNLLEWYLAIKSRTSHAPNKIELPGGGKENNELFSMSAVREIGEELSLTQIKSKPEYITNLHYQIPGFPKVDNGLLDSGYRMIAFFGIEVNSSNYPHFIYSNELKIERVISLPSVSVIHLINFGWIKHQNENGIKEKIFATDYLNLGNKGIGFENKKKIRKLLLHYIDEKEAAVKSFPVKTGFAI